MGAAREEITEGPREGNNPLTDWDLWQNMIDQVCSGFGHSPAAAGGTETTAFTGEGQQVVGATAIASKAAEAIGQDSALEVTGQLSNDIAWQRSLAGVVLGSG